MIGRVTDESKIEMKMKMKMEIEIRAATLGDAAVLGGLCASVQELHLTAHPEVFKPVDVAGLERWFRDILASGAAKIWIAATKNAPAGYVLVVDQRSGDSVFCYERRWYELQQIGVAPEYRRRGVARALVGRVIESAAAENVNHIELNTWTFNQAAQTTFQNLGFTIKNARFGMSSDARKPGNTIQAGVSSSTS